MAASLAGVVIIALYAISNRHRDTTGVPMFVALATLFLAVLLLPFWLAAMRGLRPEAWWRSLGVGLALQGVAAVALVVNNETLWSQCGGYCDPGHDYGAGYFATMFIFVVAFLVGTVVLIVSWVGKLVSLIRPHRTRGPVIGSV